MPTTPKTEGQTITICDYVKLLEEARTELEAETEFLREAISEPIRFFTETKDRLKSHRSILYRVLDFKSRRGPCSPHEFQQFLITKLDGVFQDWLQKNKKELSLSIRLRNPSTFPSLFAVYDNDTEILQFNIFEKTYGIRQRPLTEEEILMRGQEKERQLRTLKQAEERKLKELANVKEKPYLYIFTSWEGFFHLFLRYEQTMKRIRELMEWSRGKIETLDDQIKANRESLPSIIQANVNRQKAIEAAEPFFLELGYSLETRQEKLY
mgnify:CR=1 FL=1|jgi:hypothetical protein